MVAVAYDEKRWSFTRSFDRESFGVLDKWSVTRGGRTGKFDCILYHNNFFLIQKKTLRGKDNNHFRFILD